MAKKSDRPEPKKECPSCGLGVADKAMICEYCGWDFEEEDEWILQIEKLERDLMLEKQRYEPGTVNHMIESTLRNPVAEKVESSVPASEYALEVEEAPAPIEEPEEPASPPTRARKKAPAPTPKPPAPPKVRKVRSVKAPPSPPVPVEVESTPEPEPIPERAALQIPATPPPKRTVRRVKAEAPISEPASPRRVKTATVTGPIVQEAPIRKTRVVRKVKK